MTEDARFEDAASGALALRALDADDLRVISTLVQDAVFPVAEMTWDSRRRRFAVLLNRFRWEEADGRRPPERVQSLLVIDDALKVASQGIDRGAADLVVSLLALDCGQGPTAPDGSRLSLPVTGPSRSMSKCSRSHSRT